MIAHLQKLQLHLSGLDSGSEDAKAIRWALLELTLLAHKLDVAREGLKDIAGRAHSRLANSE